MRKRRLWFLGLIIVVLSPLLGCQVSVKIREYDAPTSAAPPMGNPSLSENQTVAREWMVTSSGAKVGVSKSVISDTQILVSGAKVRMEVGHE
jgi:hypothetical protein